MKKIIFLSSFLLAAASAALAQNSSAENAAAIFDENSDVSVARGMSREAVTFMLGSPSETMAANVWIYENFQGKGLPGVAKYDTLLLVFKDNQVSELRLCEGKPLREYVAKLKAKSAPKAVAAK